MIDGSLNASVREDKSALSKEEDCQEVVQAVSN